MGETNFMRSFDIIVAGTGPAGLPAALACAKSRLSVAVVGPVALTGSAPDTRTAALFTGSLALLQQLGAMVYLEEAASPLRGIRIVDDGDRLIRAPEVLFEAREMDLDDFGANVPQQALSAALWSAIAENKGVHAIVGQVAGLELAGDRIEVRLDVGAVLSAGLVVAADGRNSVCRQAAGIATETWDYPQVAIAAQFSHSREHHGISTEFHRPAGPCTVVPMPGKRSSLVWVERPAIARRLVQLDDANFARALEERLHGILGQVSDIGERRSFPLSGLKAKSLGKNRVVLVGEAGHTLPPIGAQGLNLGLRDAATLADLIISAKARSADIGGPELLSAYDDARRIDVDVRTGAVDLLNRSLLVDLLPVNLARGLGMHMIGSFSGLKRQVMRAGLEPPGNRPSLMRGSSAA